MHSSSSKHHSFTTEIFQKHFKRNTIIILVLFHCMLFYKPNNTHAQTTIDFQVFYDELSPYGTWVYNPDYGPVWVPGVNHQFYPYGSDGYWVYTYEGWTWVSFYSWGWAPFHYGRWFYDPFYRWVWVPGYQWSCAWVAWRQYEGYYGWTPIAPGVSLVFAFSNYYEPQHDHWRFVHRRYLGRRDMNQHFSGFGGYLNYLKKSNAIENIREYGPDKYKYHAGPSKSEVEKYSGKKIRPVLIETTNTPIQKHQRDRLMIYRPEIKESVPNQPSPNPKKLDEWKGHPPTRGEIKTETHHPVKEIPSEEISKPQIANPRITIEPHEPKRETDQIREQQNQKQPQIKKPAEQTLPRTEQPLIKSEDFRPKEKQKTIQPAAPPKVDKPIRRPVIIRQPQLEQKQPTIRQIPKQEPIKKATEKAIKNLRKEP